MDAVKDLPGKGQGDKDADENRHKQDDRADGGGTVNNLADILIVFVLNDLALALNLLAEGIEPAAQVNGGATIVLAVEAAIGVELFPQLDQRFFVGEHPFDRLQ